MHKKPAGAAHLHRPRRHQPHVAAVDVGHKAGGGVVGRRQRGRAGQQVQLGCRQLALPPRALHPRLAVLLQRLQRLQQQAAEADARQQRRRLLRARLTRPFLLPLPLLPLLLPPLLLLLGGPAALPAAASRLLLQLLLSGGQHSQRGRHGLRPRQVQQPDAKRVHKQILVL
jgi:hypothetical protein